MQEKNKYYLYPNALPFCLHIKCLSFALIFYQVLMVTKFSEIKKIFANIRLQMSCVLIKIMFRKGEKPGTGGSVSRGKNSAGVNERITCRRRCKILPHLHQLETSRRLSRETELMTTVLTKTGLMN